MKVIMVAAKDILPGRGNLPKIPVDEMKYQRLSIPGPIPKKGTVQKEEFGNWITNLMVFFAALSTISCIAYMWGVKNKCGDDNIEVVQYSLSFSPAKNDSELSSLHLLENSEPILKQLPKNPEFLLKSGNSGFMPKSENSGFVPKSENSRILPKKPFEDSEFLAKQLSENLYEQSVYQMNNTLSRLNYAMQKSKSENQIYMKNYEQQVGKKIVAAGTETVQYVKRVVNATEVEVKNEKKVLEEVIKEALIGILDWTAEEVKKNVLDVDAATNSTAAFEVMQKAIAETEYKITSGFGDIYSMYDHYDTKASNIIGKKAMNGLNQIKYYFNARRKNDVFSAEKVQVCYTINRQNDNIMQELTRLANTVGTIARYKHHLNTKEGLPEASVNFVRDIEVAMDAEISKGVKALLKVGETDECFLENVIDKQSALYQDKIKKRFIGNLKKTLISFPTVVNATVANFTLITDEHMNIIREQVEIILNNVSVSIIGKSAILENTAQTQELREKTSFPKLSAWMEGKLASFKDLLNPSFENKKINLTNNVDKEAKFITHNIFPVLSILNIKSYVPTAECPHAVAFHSLIKEAIKQYTPNGELVSFDHLEDFLKEFNMSYRDYLSSFGKNGT